MAKKSAPKKKAAKKAAAPKAKPAVAKKIVAAPVPKVRSASKPKNASTNSYTFSEFIENVKGFCGLQKRSQAKEIAEDLAALIKDSLRKGYKIPLLGLGKLYVRQSKARIGRNPATGQEIQIPAKKRIRFTAAKALKEAVLK
jgi:DNA-binding protein HU-beta